MTETILGKVVRGRKVWDCNVSSTFFGKQGERLDIKNEKIEFIFPIFLMVAAFSFPAKAILLFFQCFLPRNVSKSSFFLEETNFLLFSLGRVEIFFVPQVGNCCPSGG